MDKASMILEILGDAQEPQSLHALHTAIAQSISERSLRRILKDLTEQGKVISLGGNKNRRYQLKSLMASDIAHAPRPEPVVVSPKTSVFSAHSLEICQKLSAPIYTREPCTYRENWLISYIPNQTYYLSKRQRTLLHESGGQKAHEPAGTYAKRIYDRLLIDLSYNSSRLEGNTYSLLDTERLLLQGKKAEGKLDADRVMILNHKEAIRFLVEGANRIEIDEESIRSIHYLLADNLVLKEDVGNIRQDSVKIAGSVYTPLDNPARIQKVLSAIIEKTKQINDVFEQSFFLLVHLSYLQAFVDVNKRVARLAANIPLVKNNYVPISFNEIEKSDYQTAVLAIYELNEPGPLSDLFVFSYTKTCKAYQVSYEAMVFDVQRVRYRTQRRALIAQMIKQNIQYNHWNAFVEKTAKKQIPVNDQEKFIEDVLDDLHDLDRVKLAGLGISRQEFEAWREFNK